MVEQVNPQGLALWEITHGAMDDEGNLAGSRITAANRAKLLAIGKGLEEGGRALASALDEMCESCHVSFWYPKHAQ